MDADLRVGASGVFEVAVDGRVVAARRTFAFPAEDEILAAVEQALKPA